MDDNTIIWRYMDLSKLIDLLISKSLYLTRADKFLDPFEGSFSNFNMDLINRELEKIIMESKKGDKGTKVRIYDDEEWVTIKKIPNDSNKEDFLSAYQLLREIHFINCWHMNHRESDAMWKLYLKSDEGVAIKTTVGRLKKAIKESGNTIIDRVEYIDYINGKFNDEYRKKYKNSAHFLHKRNHFEHENEIRIIKKSIEKKEDGEKYKELDVNKQKNKHGIKVNVNLSELIEEVYVCPTAPLWFFDVVKSILETYGKDNRLDKLYPIQSSMSGIPNY